jgi:NifU-like protein involved in Fe-S cluster formation
MLQEQVTQLEARVKKEASTPVTPAPPAAPAPSAEMEQLKKENKDLSDRLAKVEKTMDEILKKNSALEKENAELKAKVAELEKRNAELEKAQKQETPPAEKQNTEAKQALTDEQIKERAKELHDAIGYFTDDEAKVYSSLSGLSAADQGRLSVAFKKEYGEDMDAYIADSLDETDLAIVMKLREGSRPGTEDATKVYNIFNGWTNKDDLTQALKGKSVEEIAAMAKEYEYITGESFQDAVKSEFLFESDRKPFLDIANHAQEALQLVENGSPVFKRAHQAVSSLSPDASIDEARAWATKNRALYEGLGATPGNQEQFVDYLKTVHGFKKEEPNVDPGEFFNQKIADTAVREIANAVTYRTIRSFPTVVGGGAAPITVPEPDLKKIEEIYTSLSDLPQVQGLIKKHPDVKRFALGAKPS